MAGFRYRPFARQPRRLSRTLLGRGNAAAWTPASLSPVVWLKQNTLLFSDDGVTPIADTDPIYRWGDSSGNNNHAKQVTLGNRPIYSSGSGWASFTAASHFMTITNSASIQFALNAPRTYAALMQLTATGTHPVICGRGANNDEFRFSSSTAKPAYFTGGAVDGCTSSAAVSTGVTTMVVVAQSITEINLYIGNTLRGTDASAVAAANSTDICIGSRTGTTQFLSMKLLEYLVLPTAISTDNLALLETYWGV